MQRIIYISIIALFATVILCPKAGAQGSIFGSLHNADQSIPADSEISFFGFIDNRDNEIHLHSGVGAGYDSGNWHDDFQNYQGAAAGSDYHYFFFNSANGESTLLNKLIPSNSYQAEDVILTTFAIPSMPAGLRARRTSASAIRLDWQPAPAVSWHVYRRAATSEGPFFRIDNPTGLRSDRGASDTFFVDSGITENDSYSYVIIAEDNLGAYSAPSAPVTSVDAACCQGTTGNIDLSADGIVDIGDLTVLIAALFITVTELECPEAGNVDGDPEGIIDIGDVSVLITSLFLTLTPTAPCQ